MEETEVAEIEEIVDPEVDGETVETVELEEWMKEEETVEQTADDASKTVPVGKFVGMKKKFKGQLSDAEKDNARLRKERDEALKNGPKKPTALVRPNLNDYTTDEEYEVAKGKYDDDRLDDTYNRRRLKEQQDSAVQKNEESISISVDEHFERVETLVKESGISAEKVEIAHDNFSNAMAEAFPNLGKKAGEIIISTIGKGSEKVIYSLGINKAKRDKLIDLAKADPNGMKLAVYLGELKQQLTKPKKPRSNAPDPAKKINGDETPADTGSIKKLKKQYDKIGAGTTESYQIKQKAKKMGADVSEW